MSASSLLIAVAPPEGPKPSALQRDAATADADFAAILDETVATDTPAAPPPHIASRIGKEPAAEDAAVQDAEPVEAEIVPTPLLATPPPTPPAILTVTPTLSDSPAQTPAAEPDHAAPAPEIAADMAVPASIVGAPFSATERGIVSHAAAPSTSSSDVSSLAPLSQSADQTDLAATPVVETETVPATLDRTEAAPAPTAAPVAPPPRPARPIDAAPVSNEKAVPHEDQQVEADASPPEAAAQAVASSGASEAPRLRDIIERASTGRSGANASAQPTGDGPPPSAQSDVQSPSPTPPSTPRPAAPQAEPIPAAGSAPLEPDAPPAPGAAPPTVSQGRPADAAASVVLSTLSHATIETTARIAARIARTLEGRSTRFEMALTPDGLGQVDVSLAIEADGRLAARLAFDNPLAAIELRGRVDDLRRQLQEAGFTLADDALSFTERDPSGQFGGQFGDRGGAFDRRTDTRGARAFGAASRLEADADRQPIAARWIPLALTPDRVDMKV